MTNFLCRNLIIGSIAINLICLLNQPAVSAPVKEVAKTSSSSSANAKDEIRELLKLSKTVPETDFERIIDARGFGLPDNATCDEITEAALRKQFEGSVKMYGWPANLSSKELLKLDEERTRSERCLSLNLPVSATEEELKNASRLLKEQSGSILDQYSEVYSKKLPKDLEIKALEKVMAKEKDLTKPARARAVNLPLTASWEQINIAEADKQRTSLTKFLGISANSSPEEIDATLQKQQRDERALIARRILKSPVGTSEAELQTQLKILAKALGYSSKVDPGLNMMILTSRVVLAGAVGTQ